MLLVTKKYWDPKISQYAKYTFKPDFIVSANIQ